MSLDGIDKKIIAQLLRDICVEAVVTSEQRGELEALKINAEADATWLAVAEHFCHAAEKLNQSLRDHRV